MVDGPLHAGAARRTINPPPGIGKIGGRLFGDPIQWNESDLTATVLVGGNIIQQLYPGQVTALHPSSEQRAREGTLAMIRQVSR